MQSNISCVYLERILLVFGVFLAALTDVSFINFIKFGFLCSGRYFSVCMDENVV